MATLELLSKINGSNPVTPVTHARVWPQLIKWIAVYGTGRLGSVEETPSTQLSMMLMDLRSVAQS